MDAAPCKTAPTGELVCLAGVTPPPGGFNVPQTCWQYSYHYACSSQTFDNCTPYRQNPACGVVSSSCQDYAQPSGVCDAWNYTYRCQTSAAVTSPQVNCTNGLFDTGQFTTPVNTNNTFAKAAIAQEVLRESQLYSNNGTEIFAGARETCRKGYAGLQNCCQSAPGAKTNSAMSTIAMAGATAVVKYVGTAAVNTASQYMFDAMYNNPLWTSAMDAIFTTEYAYGQTALVTAANGFQIGAYGVTYSATATVATTGAATGATGTGLFSADTILLNFGDSGVLMFNPYVFVAMVVIAVVMSAISCSQDEQMLGMHKGANLSVFKNESCTSHFLGACTGYTDTYCSFNSILAKIVNTQGKPQLGLDVTDCTGFTVAQISQLDFSRIDFSEFTASVTGQALSSMPSSSNVQTSYTAVMQATPAGSAQSGNQVTGSSIIGVTAPTTRPPPNPNLPSYGP